jgi:sterol 24-C-methyltransferase
MLKLDKSRYTDERVALTTTFSDPHNRVVSTEEIAATHDLITDIYLKGGWGPRFHYAPQGRLERKSTAIQRWERFLVGVLGAKPGMRLLDVGSGVGGPANDVARMTGAHVLGLDLSATEVEVATRRTQEARLDHLCTFQVGDFTDLSEFPDESFDGIYCFQTICYSPDKVKTYDGFRRVLKPGGRYAEYTWGTKPAFDPGNPKHVEIIEQIAFNVKCQRLEPIAEIAEQLVDSGMDLLVSFDLTELEGLDWTRPVRIFNHPLFKPVFRGGVALAARMGALPSGSKPVHDYLMDGLPYYVDGARLDIFTPCHLMVARKPL